jgi:hypothetical protein
VLEVIGHFLLKGDVRGTTLNIYGLWMQISTVLKILEHFWFKGDGASQYGHDQHAIKRSLTQCDEDEYTGIWFMSGDLNGFK